MGSHELHIDKLNDKIDRLTKELAAKEGDLSRLIRFRDGKETGGDVIEWLDGIIDEDFRRRDAELAEARRVLELAVGIPDNTIQIMRQEGLKIDDIKEPMQKLAFTIHTETCEVARQAEVVLDKIDGKVE